MNAKLMLAPLAVALLVPVLAQAQDKPDAGAKKADAVATTAATGSMPSFAGTWRIDRSKSTFPQRPDGARRGDGAGPGGGPGGAGGAGGSGGGPGAGGSMGPGGGSPGGARGDGARRMRSGMPPYVKIAQTAVVVTVADSAGTAVQEIVYADPAPAPASKGVRRLGGEWNGRSLVALGETPMGGELTETWTLKEQGRTLEIRTKVLPGDDRPALEFTRVYQRVAAK